MLLQITLIFIGFVLLLGGGDFFVKAACGLARKFEISPLVIGLTVVAFGTSAPELFVTTGAAVKGNADFSIGNIVGSNLFNILCVVGVAALIAKVHIKTQVIKKEMPVMLLAMSLFYFFAYDGIISRMEGLLLFLSILLYLITIFVSSKRYAVDDVDIIEVVDWSLLKCSILIVLSLLAMLFGANWIIDNAILLAKQLGVSDFVISVTIAAIGTSLPEIATTISAARIKQVDLVVGNAVGSNIFNVFSVVGITAFITPLNVASDILSYDFIYMLAACFLVWPLMIWRKTFGILEALFLISIYLVYIFSLF